MRKRPRKNDDIHNGFGEWVTVETLSIFFGDTIPNWLH